MIDFVRKQPNHGEGNAWNTTFARQHKKYPWENKVRQAVWRGSKSGARPIHETLVEDGQGNLRIRMIKITHQNQTSFDDIFNVKRARKGSEFAMPFEDFQKFVAVLDVDGNAWSERFGKLLCLNSVVLKVEPEFVDYFMPTLEPWIHYVPIRMDSSDIWNITAWVLDPLNYAAARQIVQNANDWCARTMQYSNLMHDFLSILSFYVEKLDQHDTYWHSKWTDYLSKEMDPNHHDWAAAEY